MNIGIFLKEALLLGQLAQHAGKMLRKHRERSPTNIEYFRLGSHGHLLTPLTPYPALLLRKDKNRVIVVADLHIGWEVALTQEGIHVPSQTPKMKDKLLKLVDLYKPTGLLFLGDVKHTIARVEFGEWRDIPDFFETLSQKVNDIKVVLGNHDGNLEALLPTSVELVPPTGLAMLDTGFFHGNAWPSPDLLRCPNLVMGHVHPTVAFRDPLGFRTTAQVWVRAKLNREQLAKAVLKSTGIRLRTRKDPLRELRMDLGLQIKASELFIMPYFNDFLGGRPINRSTERAKTFEYLGPVLRSGGVEIESAEVYLLDGTFLGTVNQLRAIG